MWNEKSTEEKLKIKQQFLAEMSKYNEAMAQYKKSLSEEDHNRLLEAQREEKEQRKQRLEKLHSNKPPRPLNPYIKFLREKYAEKKLHAVSI